MYVPLCIYGGEMILYKKPSFQAWSLGAQLLSSLSKEQFQFILPWQGIGRVSQVNTEANLQSLKNSQATEIELNPYSFLKHEYGFL